VAATDLISACATDGAPAEVLDHLARDKQQTAFLQGFGVGGPGTAIGGTDLAEHAAWTDDRQRQLAAVRGSDHHLDPAGDDHGHGVVRIAGGEQDLAAAERPQPRCRGQGLQVLVRRRTEQIGPVQELSQVGGHRSAQGSRRVGCVPSGVTQLT
jgi:hypothetical protein